MPLQLTVTGASPTIYDIHWSPAALVSDSTAPMVTVLTSAPTVFTVTVTNKYDSTDVCTASIPVNNPADTLPVQMAPDASTCPSIGVRIGVAPLAGYTYLWAPSPKLSCLPCSAPVATPVATASYTVAITDTASGCKGYDTVVVAVVNVVANAGADQAVCNGATVTIGTPDPSAGVWDYSWQPAASPWQSGTTQFSAQPQVLYSSIVPLTYTLTVTDSASGCQVFDTVVLSSNVAPGALAGTALTICPGDTATLGTTPKPGFTYTWMPAAGLSCTACAQPLAYPAATTTYTVSATSAGCALPLLDTVVVTVDAAPVFAFADQTICPGAGAPIGLGAPGNPAAVPGVTGWMWMPASFLSCTACPNPVASPPVTTSYTITTTTAAGCAGKDTVVVTPSIAVSAGADKIICPGDSALLGTPAVAGVTYSWSPAAGLSCMACAQPMASLGATTVYTLIATNGVCTVVDTSAVIVGSLPLVSAGTPVPLCSGGCATIGFFGYSGYAYQWTPTIGISSPTNATTVACPASTTTYTLVQTDNSSGCSNTATVTLPVFGTAPTATGGSDTLCAGSAVTMQLSVSPAGPGYSYAWSPVGDCPRLLLLRLLPRRSSLPPTP